MVKSQTVGVDPDPQPAMGRRERRVAATRVRLFRSALALIARKGLANVTVEDITEAADVGKGTFFNYFSSKDHVLGVMAEIQLGKILETAPLAEHPDTPVRVVLGRMMQRLAEEPGRNPRMARAFLSSFHSSAEVRAIIRRHLGEGRKAIAKLVAIGQERGEIDRHLNPQEVATHFMRAFMGTMLLWSIDERPTLRACVAATFEQFWKSIAASERRDRS
jgi:AcrR family transcriptional regulator